MDMDMIYDFVPLVVCTGECSSLPSITWPTLAKLNSLHLIASYTWTVYIQSSYRDY